MNRECAAGELAERSELALASVSEHLKVLRKCGLLGVDKRGRHWMYRTDRQLLARTLETLAKMESSDGT